MVVGTPIGNLGDLSRRAAETLAAADVIACEDTRHTGMLLARTGIAPKRLLSLHEHNEASRTAELLGLLADGMTVALVSDAGMPVVSDPGARLVAAAADQGIAVLIVPGPSAGIAAYAVSGLATGRYHFEGFLPRRGPERRRRVNAVAASDCPSIIFESPVRVAETLDDLARACGTERRVAICRELTKLHEHVWRGNLGGAVTRAAGSPAVGEHVLVVDGAGPPPQAGHQDMEALLRHHLGAGMSRRDAVAATAGELSVSRRAVYDVALKLPPAAEGAPDADPSESSGTWTDSHCHVHGISEPLEVLKRAKAAGVRRVVCIGTDETDSLAAIGFVRRVSDAASEDFAAAFATVGQHPHDAVAGTGWIEGVLSARPAKVVGIGECGLDYHYDHSPRDVQRRAFAEQIELAHRFGMPLVIHTREAWDDTFALLQKGGVPARLVFHCFTGGPEEAIRCLEIGAFLSFSGIVTFQKADDLRAAAEVCPLDRLLIETDSPFLAPLPHRGHQNEPMWVPLVGAAVAQAKGIAVAEVARTTDANAGLFFGLDGVDQPARG